MWSDAHFGDRSLVKTAIMVPFRVEVDNKVALICSLQPFKTQPFKTFRLWMRYNDCRDGAVATSIRCSL
jgi:hypothetical protein